jgi:hypothetical protein
MSLKVGHFGSSTGEAARVDLAKAIVKRGVHPDLDEAPVKAARM